MKRIIAWLVLAALVIGIPGAVINTGGTARKIHMLFVPLQPGRD